MSMPILCSYKDRFHTAKLHKCVICEKYINSPPTAENKEQFQTTVKMSWGSRSANCTSLTNGNSGFNVIKPYFSDHHYWFRLGITILPSVPHSDILPELNWQLS